MRKTCWRAETGLFLGIWLILLIAGRSKFLQDPGTLWHTVVGERMLSTGQLIYNDPFSFTFEGRPWSPHQWLGECIMASLHRFDGLDTLLLATVTLLAGLYTWLAHRLIRSGLHWSLALLAVGLTIAASSSHFHIRPHLATVVGIGVTFAFIIDFEAGRIGMARLGWLVPIYVVWTNLHGGMMGGLATLAIALAGWCVWRLFGKESPIRGLSDAIGFGGLILCCSLTILVNPYGLGMPRIWRTIMAGDLPEIIVEHAPLDPSKPDGWIVLVFGAVYLAVLAGCLPRWPRVSWLLPLVWFCLAGSRIRHSPLFAVGGMLAIADMLPYNRWALRIAKSGRDLFQLPAAASHESAWRPALIPICVVAFAFALQLGRLPVPVVGHGWARLDPAHWPVELLPVLDRRQGSAGKPTPIFNEYLYGGFLIYHTPGYRVFVDDRCELYGDGWLHEYVQAEGGDVARVMTCWEREYRPFALALAQTGSAFDRFFADSSSWKRIEQTPTATLYERISAATEPENAKADAR